MSSTTRKPATGVGSFMTFKLPEAMRKQLNTLARKARHPVSEEIRQRIEASFIANTAAARDPALAELQQHIAELADVVPEWRTSGRGFDVLRAGIIALIDAMPRPTGEPPTGSLSSSTDTPEKLGSTLAQVVTAKAKARREHPKAWAKPLAPGEAIEFDFRTK
ncbi:MAG TPA: hypothetical protein VGU20_16705 [Stellaceae bacterium]|nr:hypothetical protein [Stellaceae bacterium]